MGTVCKHSPSVKNHPAQERAIMGLCQALDALQDLVDVAESHPSRCDCNVCEGAGDFNALMGSVELTLRFVSFNTLEFPAYNRWWDRRRDGRQRPSAAMHCRDSCFVAVE